MKTLEQKVVALTGAASGIGRALARELASRGAVLALSDIDEAGLRETAAQLTASTPHSTAVVDVANVDQVREWAAAIAVEFGGVDVVINNAGVAGTGAIGEITYEQFDWVFRTDLYGVLYGTKEFLPYLRQRPEGHIVNVSSVNGFVGFPGNGPYNMAKHAVKALNQTLQQELADTNVHVTSVHPGGIKTNIVRSSRVFAPLVEGASTEPAESAALFDKVARTTPERAASTIVKAILNDKQRLLVGRDAYLMDALTRLFPQRFSNLTGKAVYRLGRKALQRSSGESKAGAK